MNDVARTMNETDWGRLQLEIEKTRRTQLRDWILTPLSFAALTAWLVWRGSTWFDYACVAGVAAIVFGRLLSTTRFVARSQTLTQGELLVAFRQQLAQQVRVQKFARASAALAAGLFTALALLLSLPVLLLGAGFMLALAAFTHVSTLPRLQREYAALAP